MPFDQTEARKEPHIAIIGAGFAGLAMAIALSKRRYPNFVIYDKAADVGGTWRENTYPGVACDAPAHLYSYSFEPNPGWSKRYAPGAEILAYLKRCAAKHGLYERAEFGRKVVRFRHEGGRWTIEFEEGPSAVADIVVTALGGLHLPNKPDFPGAGAFEGPIVHTAEWRRDIDLQGKRVAVIGTAASAAQVVPELAEIASLLTVYQRTPNWIMPRPSYTYPGWAKALFAAAPPLARLYRGWYYAMLDWRHMAFRPGDNYMKRMVRGMFDKHMRAQVKDPELRAKLTPDYPLGCKRVVISDDFLPALQKPNVELVTDPIERFEKSGVRTKDGRLREVDAVILATGFRVFTLFQTVDVIGPDGRTLKEAWADGVVTLRTLSTPGFPSFFMLLGPNSGVAHNSVILMIEAQVKHLMKLIEAMTAKGAAAVEPSGEATAAFDAGLRRAHAAMVWETGCKSWFVDEAGRNYTLYPHRVGRFLKEMKAPDLSEYRFHMPAARKP